MKKRFKFKSHVPAYVLLGLLVFGVTVITCFMHIRRIKSEIGKEVAKQYETQIVVAGKGISDRIDNVELTLGDAAKEMGEKLEKSGSDSQINQVLMKYSTHIDMQKINYVSLDGEYFSSFEKEFNNKEALGELVKYTKHTCFVYQDLEDSSLYSLIHVEPVYVKDQIVGHVVGIQPVDLILETAAISSLTTIGDVFVLDRTGKIIGAEYVNSTIAKKRPYKTIQDYLSKEKKLVAKSEKEIQSENWTANDKGNTIVCETTSGDKIYVAMCDIVGFEDVVLAVAYRESVLEVSNSNVVVSAIISVVVVLLSMFLLILVQVMLTTRNSRTIASLAYEDEVTGGKNLNYFKEFAQKVLNDYKGMPFSIYRFDVANFRYINEAYGHEKADKVLKAIIEEGNEIFNTKELMVRITADQFVLISRNTLDLEERLFQFTDKVNARALDVGIRYPIKFKCGIYKVQDASEDISLMIDKANAARKELTVEDKELVAVYSDALVKDMRKIDKIESDMETALFNGEFKMFIQPKWDIKADHVSGGEALVRWIKNDGTMVYPSDFVPVFEKNGFIERLDMFMLESACKMIHELVKKGKQIYPISVNQSRVLLHNPKYIERITEILRKYNVPQGSIELEITETVFFMEKEKMFTVLNSLKSREVAISMDDFGSGYSSLNMLKDFPFDVLKIDREFFSESITSESSIWILKKIVEMARGLGIRVICEGVETQEQVEMLRDIGVSYVQGYFYSKPIPHERFEELYCVEDAEYPEELKKDYESIEEVNAEAEKAKMEAAIQFYAKQKEEAAAEESKESEEKDSEENNTEESNSEEQESEEKKTEEKESPVAE